jgi:hypothetical protein
MKVTSKLALAAVTAVAAAMLTNHGGQPTPARLPGPVPAGHVDPATRAVTAPRTVPTHRNAPAPAPDSNGTGEVGSGAACNQGWVCGTCPPGTPNAGTEWGYDPVLSRQLGIPEGVNCNARP